MHTTTDSSCAFSYANLTRSSSLSTPPRAYGSERETELTTIGRDALAPYQSKVRSKKNSFSITKIEEQPQSARSILTQRVQQATSTTIDVPKSHHRNSKIVTSDFIKSVNQDRALFESVKKNLEKVTFNVFKSFDGVQASIKKYVEDTNSLIDNLVIGHKRLSDAMKEGKTYTQQDFEGLKGLIKLADKVIGICTKTSEQQQKAMKSACLDHGEIFGKLICLNFELREKELDLYTRRLEKLSTREDAELKRIVEVHGLKLVAEAKMFKQLMALAELELKSDQQNFEQQKEIRELEHHIDMSKQEIELAEKQLANDKELGELYAYTQSQLQTHQIDANTRCELAKTAAKEAVKMERTRMERETRIHDTNARRDIEGRRIQANLDGVRHTNNTNLARAMIPRPPCIIM